MGRLRTHSTASRLALALGAIAILCVAAWLRFADLGDRPLHFDEGTNARILSTLLEEGVYTFNPKHFHGPFLSLVSAPITHCLGENTWQTFSKIGLRATAALCGLLAVAAGLGLCRIGRHTDGLAAAAFLATSPLLVYYSRMWIHEPLFAVCGLVTLIALKAFLQHPRVLYAVELGVGVGLMAATRETFVFSLFAWGVASIIWLLQAHPSDSPLELLRRSWRAYSRLLLLSFVIVAGIIVASYSSFGKNPAGVSDFFRAYLVYDTVPGHEKPALYYLELLLWPKHRAGLWWTEIGVLLLALYGYFLCPRGETRSAVCRFLMHSGAIHLAIYSLLAYKTPWLASLAWVHFCLAAGIGAVQLIRTARGWWRIPAAAIIAAILIWQGMQSDHATGRLASDARNPYAYVPTSRDVERMGTWLEALRQQHPPLDQQAVAVVGSFYWPLPWYLRGFSKVSYWETLPEDAAHRPLLLVLSTAKEADLACLKETHECFPRGLRHEVLVTVAIRKDIWGHPGGNSR
ncbi:MAG: TIGR03663 family protein [Verrucomicrobia bacterium]|nr:TIGR03663 family protein [Verrucomicrobiota bacterium]